MQVMTRRSIMISTVIHEGVILFQEKGTVSRISLLETCSTNDKYSFRERASRVNPGVDRSVVEAMGSRPF